MISFSWQQVLAWRMRRQFLDPPGDVDAAHVVTRLCGVQAQVASAAELAVAIRKTQSRPGELGQALADRSMIKTWAMRGTLHVLTPAQGAAWLALLAAPRSWERPSWQRAFITVRQLDALTEAVRELLDDQPLSRDQLVAGVSSRTGDPVLAEHLRSGWGSVLKPLAWQGHLCYGPTQGTRVTFARPDRWLPAWPGLPSADDAARVAVPAYLGAYGPASMEAFSQWLSRGAAKQADLRRWLADLHDELVLVQVEGAPAYARRVDVEEIAATVPPQVVRLLPGFDQYVLGPGTGEAQVVPPDRRALVSKAAGWIAPVIVVGGRVAGTWQTAGGMLEISLFAEAGSVPSALLEAEAHRLAAWVGQPLRLSVRTI